MGINDLGKIARRPRLSEEICAAIEKSIACGELIAGQQLPPAKVLAENFGVSRAVADEAVARLRANGRVETPDGLGTFVTLPPRTLNFRFWQGEAQALIELREIFELRASIEASIADLAARRRTADDIRAMQSHLAAMEDALQNGADGSTSEDAFHRAIVAATRNSQTFRLFEFFSQHFTDSRRIAWSAPVGLAAQLREGQREHCALFAAIAAGDPALARRAARGHLDNAAQRAGIDLAELSGSGSPPAPDLTAA